VYIEEFMFYAAILLIQVLARLNPVAIAYTIVKQANCK